MVPIGVKQVSIIAWFWFYLQNMYVYVSDYASHVPVTFEYSTWFDGGCSGPKE